MNRIMNYVLFVLALSSSTFAMGQPAEGKEPGSPFGMLFLIVGIFAIMYFFMIRPQKKQQQKKQEMINNLKAGDIMNPNPKTIHPDSLVAHALDIMRSNNITQLLVEKDADL